MSHKPASRSFVLGANLALCLALALSVAPAGLAEQPAGEQEQNEVTFLPLALKNTIPFIESSGVLDSSFAGDGRALANFGGSDDIAHAAVLQPDGKIIAAGDLYGAVRNFALARYNLDGSLDTLFGGDGMVTDDFNGQGAQAEAILLQPDGKIVVAGYITADLAEDFALARFNPDGSLDLTFSSDGRVQTDFGTRGDRAFAVALDPASGKIIAAGSATGTIGPDFAVARYHPDGSLDTAFSSDGLLTTNFDDHEDRVAAVLVQPGDGKIVAAGSSGYADEIYGYSNVALARYNPDGSLDTSFGIGGKVAAAPGGYGYCVGEDLLLLPGGSYFVAGYTYTDYAAGKYDFSLAKFTSSGSLAYADFTDFAGENDYGFALALQGDDKIIVAGYTVGTIGDDLALARYYVWGGLDTSFGIDGKLVIDIEGISNHAYAVVARPGGSLVAVGDGHLVADDSGGYADEIFGFSDVALVQVTSAGALDSSFSGDGIQLTNFAGSTDRGYAAALQPDGRLVVAGLYFGDRIDFGLARFNPDGSLDTAFGGDGLVDVSVGASQARDVAVQADGKIVAVGRTFSGNFAVVRLNPDGSLDTTFAGTGTVATDIAGGDDYGEAVLLQADGKIIAAGTGSSNFALVRYLPDGSLDPGFGAGGKVTINFGEASYAYDAALQPDGRIVVVGMAIPSLAVVRLNPDGSLDTSFAGDGTVTTIISSDPTLGDAIAVQPDGKIVAAGYIAALTGEYIAIARYNPDGSLDSSFSGDGMLTLDYPGGADLGYDLAIQPNGKILLAGVTYGASSDYALLRLNPNGSLDPTFAGDGLLAIDFAGGIDQGYALALLPDGRILVAGFASNGLDYDFAVARIK